MRVIANEHSNLYNKQKTDSAGKISVWIAPNGNILVSKMLITCVILTIFYTDINRIYIELYREYIFYIYYIFYIVYVITYYILFYTGYKAQNVQIEIVNL